MVVGRAVAVVVLFGTTAAAASSSLSAPHGRNRGWGGWCGGVVLPAEVERETVLGGDQTAVRGRPAAVTSRRCSLSCAFACPTSSARARAYDACVSPRRSRGPERFLCSRCDFDRVRGGSYVPIPRYPVLPSFPDRHVFLIRKYLDDRCPLSAYPPTRTKRNSKE